jgi:hypothetical protein
MPAAKTADLCWGQHHHLLRYHQVPADARHEAHITTSYPLPPGCTTAHVRAALDHLVRRHEVLRTVYDIDGPWPRQRVQPPAPLPVVVATTEDDGTPPPAEVVRRLSETPFRLAEEWPLRACAITSGGALRRLHLVFNHLAFDDVALDVLSHELDALLAARVAGQPVTFPPVRHQPVDLARQEAARPAGAVDAALEHWRSEVAQVPADVFAHRRDRAPRPGAAHSASFTVPSLLATARGIAGRHRVWPSAVHLAAYAVAVAAYTGEPVVANRLYSSQREASGFGSVLTCLSYPTLVRLDLADDPPWSEVLRRAAARVRAAMDHAHVPHDRIVERLAVESSRRGQQLRISSEVNFLDNAPRSCGTRRERFTVHAAPHEWATAGSDLYFRVYEWADGITLALQVLDEVMDRAAAEAFLRGYALLLDIHRDPAVDLPVSRAAALFTFPPAPAHPMTRVGGDAVDPAQTVAALREHPSVRAVELRAVDGALTAWVDADPALTPAELRRHTLGAVADRPAARCPDRFRVTGPDGRVDEGDGRTPSAPVVRTAAERALVEVVAAVNDLDGVSLADSYTEAGGRALRLPRVLELLDERGWTGPRLRELLDLRPLGAVADRMVPMAADAAAPAVAR